MNTSAEASKRVGNGAKFNAIQQVIAALSAIVGLGLAVRLIPKDELSVIQLIWLFTNYLALLDLGLGRALSQSVAAAIGRKNRDEVPTLIGTAFAIVIPSGVIAGGLLSALSGTILHALNQPFPADAQPVLVLTGAIVPFAMLGIVLVGVIQADGRFAQAASIQIPVLVVTYLGPAVVYLLGFKSLYAFALIHLLTRALGALLMFIAAHRAYGLKGRLRFSAPALKGLLSFGGWVAVSSLIGPLLAQFDRLIVLRLAGTHEMNTYSAIVDAGSRALVIPISLAVGMFPVASSLIAGGSMSQLGEVVRRSLQQIIAISAPLVFVGVGLSHELLGAWLGKPFQADAPIFAFVLIGCFANAVLWWIPYTLFQAAGKPIVPALVLLAECLIYFPIFGFVLSRFGLLAASGVWMIRAFFEGAVISCVYRRTPLFVDQPILSSIPKSDLIWGIGLVASGQLIAMSPLSPVFRFFAVTALLAPSAMRSFQVLKKWQVGGA